jgi:hypothetical protein
VEDRLASSCQPQLTLIEAEMGAACITAGGLGHFRRKIFLQTKVHPHQDGTFQEIDVDISAWQHISSSRPGPLHGIVRNESRPSSRGGSRSLFRDAELSNASPRAPPGPSSTPGNGVSMQLVQAPPSLAWGDFQVPEDIAVPQGAVSLTSVPIHGRNETSIWGRRRGQSRSTPTRPHPTVNTSLSR